MPGWRGSRCLQVGGSEERGVRLGGGDESAAGYASTQQEANLQISTHGHTCHGPKPEMHAWYQTPQAPAKPSRTLGDALWLQPIHAGLEAEAAAALPRLAHLVVAATAGVSARAQGRLHTAAPTVLLVIHDVHLCRELGGWRPSCRSATRPQAGCFKARKLQQCAVVAPPAGRAALPQPSLAWPLQSLNPLRQPAGE